VTEAVPRPAPLTSLLASTGRRTVVAASTSAIRPAAARMPRMPAKVTDEPVPNTSTARVIRIAPLASRHRPGAESATSSPAAIRTRGSRNWSRNPAAPASRDGRPVKLSLPHHPERSHRC
jgi:hypothetical protein